MAAKKKGNSKQKSGKAVFVRAARTYRSRGTSFVGTVHGMVDFAERPEVTVQANCSCRGEYENCFRCSGTGVYEKVIASGATGPSSMSSAHRPVLAVFSSDSRGGHFGIREQGRFGSDAVHDNFSDESGA